MCCRSSRNECCTDTFGTHRAVWTEGKREVAASRSARVGTKLLAKGALLLAAGMAMFEAPLVAGQTAQTSAVIALPAAAGQGECQVGREWSAARLQSTWPSDARSNSTVALGYIGRQQEVASADLVEARSQVSRVVHASGLEMNLELVADSSTPAAAQMINGQRVILFDPRFMAQVADKICPDWGAMSILAHEVGHHLAGHTLRQSTEPWRDELEADQFSGFVLARLGASEAETVSAAAKILPEEPTPTHPGRKDRVAAILHGWQNAEAMLAAEVDQTRRGRGLVPMRQDRFVREGDLARSSDLDLVGRIILYADPNDYYITRGGRVDTYDGTERRPVGKKSLANSADYAWALSTSTSRLDIDFDGHVFIRLPSGAVDEVGIVVSVMPQVAITN